MSNFFSKLANSGVQNLSPYQPGKPVSALEREYGVSNVVKLASNENPLGPSPRVIKAITNGLDETARYPDGNGFELKHKLAKIFQLEENQITLGNGSNDVLEIIARTFASATDEIMFSEHAFAVYPIVTQAIGAKANVVKARKWGHDLPAMAAAITSKTKIIFLANPNNPTGTWFSESELSTFLKAIPENIIIVLDEAYFEFASHPEYGQKTYPNGIEYLSQYDNLIVTRTFSKAYGLAGLRVGFSVSHPDIANLLNRVRQPFNVNQLALVAAETVLDDVDYLEKSIILNAKQMQVYVNVLTNAGIEYIPSAGNFICVKVERSADVYEALLKRGIIVRPVANYLMPDYLRISIGSESENRHCLDALLAIVKK